MKKGVSAVLFALIVMSPFVLSASNATNTSIINSSTILNPSTINAGFDDKVNKAYSCLENLVKDKTTLSLQEAVFSTLALGSKSNFQAKIDSEKKSGENCWPAVCTLKDTAQVLLAYNRIGKESSGIESWIESKSAIATELTWYLEIDSTNRGATQCALKYDNSDKKINIGEDMKISGSPGNCFSISNSGYWLTIRQSCLDKSFSISCDQDFVTTLIYQKGSGTIYVSSETHSASSLGTTEETVNARCLKTGNVCDYEGTLWGALALSKAGKDVNAYIPYLSAGSEDHRQLISEAFVYMLTGSEDEYSLLIQGQKQGKYWKATGSPYGTYYDTSLAMLALSGTSANELENAKNYLLGIQTSSGCWNNDNIRDTAFILYSGWPKNVGKIIIGKNPEQCEAAGFWCEKSAECVGASGKILSNYECQSYADKCCSVSVPKQSCSERGGAICSAGQQCDGEVVSTPQGSCCLKDCIAITEPTQDECETNGGVCRNVCNDDETEGSDECSEGRVCCMTSEPSKGGSWLWIAILVILIILLGIGILYRDKLRVWWFSFKGKAKTAPVTRPSPPTYSAAYPPQFRPMPSSGNVPRRPMTPKDREMEETLKKLRDMSS